MSTSCRPSGRAAVTRTLRRAANLVLATLVGTLASTAVHAQSASFTLYDKTNLPAGTYKIYYTGYSTTGPNGPLVLQSDGSWAVPANTTSTATLPCYEFVPGTAPQIQINSADAAVPAQPGVPAKPGISARVYYFVVTDLTTFPSCNPTGGATGLFNQPDSFTYTYPAGGSMAVTAATVVSVTGKTFPAWTFSEIGASSASGTIDLSQVDFVAFPMSTTATVSANTPPNPAVIGNPIGSTDNPGDAVNHLSMRDSYATFIDGLAQAVNDNKSCSTDSTPAVCAYFDLLQNVTTSTLPNAVPQYVIQNPGGYLGQNTSATQGSRLNGVFDGLIGKLWSATLGPTLMLDTGGLIAGVPQDLFISSIVTMTYPGSVPAITIDAMKFTGVTTGYVAYVFNPKQFATGCANGTIPGTDCSGPTSSGWQVFAGGGALGTPSTDTYTNLVAASALPTATTNYGSGGYVNIVARLGLLISGAMNRGVALTPCTVDQPTWQCWQDERYWYPTKVSAAFPDITQNVFSRWMHTATIHGTPMFLRPPQAVKSASGVPGGGRLMGMAYGFSNDENPTPAVTTPPQPEVPSKMDQTIVYGGAGPYAITFGPWVTQGAAPTLSVATLGNGAVTSSPAGIDCGSTCSHAYPLGTVVILTASPGVSAVFGKWSGACTGRSTTCTVTLTGTTTVTAEFYSIAAAAPSAHGLHVVVNGAGLVTSAPAGISCGSTCSAAFNANTPVTLSAGAAAGSTFAGWSGACSGASTSCTVTMSQARNVGASFVAATQYTLTVTGGANGIVTTSPGAIDCGTTCIAGFAAGTAVNVIARPNPGYRFAGWSGACTGTNTCDLTMNANLAVQATFAAIPAGHYTLTVHDYGEGTIVSAPAGIDCGASCTAVYPAGTDVTLYAAPKPGYQFAGWSGACAGTGACVVWMGNVENVSASFVPSAVPAPPPDPIPTLAEWALILMSFLIMAIGSANLRSGATRGRRIE